RASGTSPTSGAGARTSRRVSAATSSWKWCHRTSWRRSSPPAAESLAGLRAFPVAAAPLARGVVVGVGCLLGGSVRFGYVAKVDPDSRPGGRAAAHGVDQHVVDRESLRGFGMLRLPALEARERGGLVG